MNGPLLRMLDANANRAREGLRVVEDYARFALDDDELSKQLKHLRHDLAACVGPYLPAAILHRDTPGDVGTDNKTASEGMRPDLASVVTAAGKRLGEALRVIEEVLKTHGGAESQSVESVRYRWYALEQAVAGTFRPNRFGGVALYVLVTESVCRRPWLEAAEQAILGGADCLQLREKSLESGELLRRAQALVQLCRRHRVICIINDRPDVAMLARADGVHVGQDDLPARAARQAVGNEMLLGVSTHNVEQARRAFRDGADYIGVGPVFRSTTKPRDFLPGLDFARQVSEAMPDRPAVAIAGINAGNVDEVLATGIRAVAVGAAVLGVQDVRAAAAELKQRLVNAAATRGPLSKDTDVPTSAGVVGQS
jgi:thiamine-phosphate pyrophosphorylase